MELINFMKAVTDKCMHDMKVLLTSISSLYAFDYLINLSLVIFFSFDSFELPCHQVFGIPTTIRHLPN